MLQVIADISEEALYRSLGELQAAEFLYETSLFPERAYTFKHALTHEVAYGSLLHERRQSANHPGFGLASPPPTFLPKTGHHAVSRPYPWGRPVPAPGEPPGAVR